MDIEKNIDINCRGNILVLKDNNILFERVNGYSDLANKRLNKIDTKFGSASAGKFFVAIAILKLIELSKLHFEDNLGQLLNIDLKDIDKEVTVEELLTHSSGVPDYFDEETMEEYEELWIDFPNYRVRKNSDLLPLFIDKKMMYKRGEKFQYNNTGYVLLAMIIESVTGELFDNYIKENIFKVGNMDNTGYYELDRLPENTANNYIYDEVSSDYRTNIYSIDVKGTGAGGAFITVEDIISFWKNLINNKFLSKELTDKALSTQIIQGESPISYGYGVWIREYNGIKIPYFQGMDPGVSFISEYNIEENIISVLVSNYGDNVWGELKKIREILY